VDFPSSKDFFLLAEIYVLRIKHEVKQGSDCEALLHNTFFSGWL